MFFAVSTLSEHEHSQGRSQGGLGGIPINIGMSMDTTLMVPLRETGDSKFELKAVELMIGATVDPFFDFFTSISYHEGETDVEEAWVSAVLPFNLKVKFWRELVPFGYLNRFHEHDFPQIDQLYVIENLLTDHGLVGDGGHIEFLAPFLIRL